MKTIHVDIDWQNLLFQAGINPKFVRRARLGRSKLFNQWCLDIFDGRMYLIEPPVIDGFTLMRVEDDKWVFQKVSQNENNKSISQTY